MTAIPAITAMTAIRLDTPATIDGIFPKQLQLLA
jgi:hypothetical protein